MSSRRRVGATRALTIAFAGWWLLSCSTDSASGARSGAERTGRTAQALNTNPAIGNFVLYAKRSVSLGSHDQVVSGDVGVAAVAVAGFGPQLVVGDHVQVNPSSNLLSPSVTLGSKAEVGDVQTTSLVDNGAQSVGTVAPYPAAAMPPVPVAGSPATSPAPVSIASHQTATLSPGSYGALSIEDHAQVTLTAGTYSFSRVSISDHVQVSSDPGDVTILDAGAFSTSGFDDIRPSGSAAAGALSILVGGNDGTNGSPPAASIGQQTQMTAIFAVPRGTLSIADHVQLTGAFIGFDVSLSDHAQVTFESGFPASAPGQVGQQQLSGYITPAMAAAPLVGPVPLDTNIEFAIGLPLRNEPALQAAITQLYNPSSPTYHQYLSPSGFAAAYGPLPAVTNPFTSFLSANGVTVETTYTNNQLYDVSAPAAVVQGAFFVNLNYYQRADGSVFYAPDREPSLDLDPAVVSIARIDGLDDFGIVVPAAGSGPVPQPPGQVSHATGVNLFMGSDFRNAYFPGVTVTGANETVAIVALDSYVPGDVTMYESCPDCNPPPSNWSPNVTVNVVPVDGLTLPPPPPTVNETILDIDMILAVAPGVAEIDVYEAPFTLTHTKQVNDILTLIANPFGERIANQIACSWLNFGGYNTAVSMYQFAMQGQSFFMGAGDNGSYADNGVAVPIDEAESAYMTIVGGTQLTTAVDKSWSSERVWNDVVPTQRGALGATGGGSLLGSLDDNYGSVPAPDYQLPIASLITLAGGNPSWRAVPDVAMTATDLGIYFKGALNFTSGTSASGPLWAGLAALINEKALGQGAMPLGFANPALYAAAQSSQYSNLFHDITAGTNSLTSSGHYLAMANYDLTTGWGTPTGNLIGYLACPSYCGNTSDTCEDLNTDPSNCGSCGNSCGIAGQCFAGQCGQVTVGMTAAATGLQICIYAIGFTPGDFVDVGFAGAPGGFGGRNGVVDANGQWAYFDEVPYDSACTSQDRSGLVTITEVDPNQAVQYSTTVVSASYFCSPGLPDIGPGAPGPTQCLAPDGTSGVFFGE